MFELAPLVPTRSVLAALAVLAVCLVATPASAQVGPINPQIAVDMPTDPLALGADNTTTLTATVSNPGNVDGSVLLVLTAPDGWTATAEPSSFPLVAGASQPVTITLLAPAAGAGAATGPLGLDATITDAAGRAAQASASVPLTRVDPLPPPPPAPWYQQPMIMGPLLVLLAAAALGGAYSMRRSKQKRLEAEAAAKAAADKAAHEAWLARETGVTLRLLDGPKPFGDRRDVIYRVEVQNVSDRPRVAILGAPEVPAGFRAAFSVSQVPLAKGERATVSVAVTPEVATPPGTRASLTVSVKPEEAQERDERLVLDVTAALPRTPATPNSRPVFLARGPISSKGNNGAK